MLERNTTALLSVEHGGTIFDRTLRSCRLHSVVGLLSLERGRAIFGGVIAGRVESSILCIFPMSTSGLLLLRHDGAIF